MDKIKKTLKSQSSKSTKTSGVNALPSNRKEQINQFTDGIVNRIIPIVNQALINKDKTIVELVQKIADLEAANKQLEEQRRICHCCLELECDCNCKDYE